MAYIELVIKIPEEMYKWVDDVNKFFNYYGTSDFVDLVKNGTPLPKGHGKLVDLDQMCEDYWDGNYMEIHFNDLDNIKTIIETDKIESEK